MTSSAMELSLAHFFGIRKHLIVPNISWGLGIHECDLLIVTKSGYLWEVEIKISKADLIRDKKKWHGHRSSRIKRLYFAIPVTLLTHINHIPERAGIVVVEDGGSCRILRSPKNGAATKISDVDRLKVAELGCMRMWGLKQKLGELRWGSKTL